MKWFKEHKLISILIIALVVLIVIFAITTKTGVGGSSVSSGFNSGMQSVSNGLENAGESIRGTFKYLFGYGDLKAEIDELKEENQSLKKQIQEIKLSREELYELENLSNVLNFEYVEKEFDLVSADLVSKDMSLWIKTFTVNAGTEKGIEKNDAVVNGMGLIGKVQDVGKGWAKVICLVDDENKVSFRSTRDASIEGICYGASNGELKGYLMDAEATIAEGDAIITSGLGIYPEGIVIGTVKSIEFNINTLMKEIEIEAACDFRHIDKVSIIR